MGIDEDRDRRPRCSLKKGYFEGTFRPDGRTAPEREKRFWVSNPSTVKTTHFWKRRLIACGFGETQKGPLYNRFAFWVVTQFCSRRELFFVILA